MPAHPRTDSSRKFKRLYYELIAVREKEKKNLAHELHDGVCQDFAQVKIDVENYFYRQRKEGRGASPEEHAQHIYETEQIITGFRNAIQKLRSFMDGLDSPLIQDAGLYDALAKYFEGISQRWGIKIHFKAQPRRSGLKREKEIVLFRIIQEALQNIIKHSRATDAWVNISFIKNKLVLVVKDNGKGFFPDKIKKIKQGSGYGLHYMRERCSFLGGQFAIRSQGNEGTKILVSVPLGVSLSRVKKRVK